MKPQSNGLVELHDNKKRESVCFNLMGFIYDEAESGGFLYTEKHQDLWDKRFAQMKAGECAYQEKCPIYAQSTTGKPKQLTLF